jgi:thioesterase domain-containing protein
LPVTTFPQTNLETALVRIWEQVLQRAPIGLQENFFDLGGTSVQAARMFAMIEESFHRRLPLSVILGAPTIEQLAASLLPSKSWDRKAFVVPIQSGGKRPVLFCVGGGAYWRTVSEHLGPGQPVFSIGLEPEAVEHMKWPNPMEKLARHIVSALCEKQAHGPYYLCGYCQDGIFAYEVARQLAMYGHEVGLLALVEARNPSPRFRVRTVNGLRRTAIRFGFQLDQLYRLFRTREIPHYIRARRGELKRFALRMSSRISPRFQLRAHQSGRIDLQEFLYLEASSSKPKPLACPTAIFRCADWPILSAGDPYFGWRELLQGRSEIHEIPGIHEEIFREPNVRVLAEKLSACLHNARPAEIPACDAIMAGD